MAGRRLRLRKRQLQRLLRGRAKRLAAQCVFSRLHNHIAIATAEARYAAAVRPDDRSRKHLRCVDNAERHRRIGSRTSVRLSDEHRKRPHRRVARCLIQKCHRTVLCNHLVVCRRSAEQAAVYQNCAAGRAGEPAAVEPRLRLTCAEIVPCAVAEYLNPGVVIVAVRPAWRVHLPCRDPGGAQRVDRECGFLSAAAKAGALRAKRADGPLIGRTVAELLRVP